MLWPQPRRCPEPFTARSAAPSGLVSENDTFARCGMRNLARSSETVIAADELHGPRQLFRAAMAPICFSRHSRVAGDALASNCRMPSATVGSVVLVGE